MCLCAGYLIESVVDCRWYFFYDVGWVVGVDVDVEGCVIWFPVWGVILAREIQGHIKEVNSALAGLDCYPEVMSSKQ